MLTTAIARIHRFNAGHPWSHNDLYLRWVLRQLPGRLCRTIDVGCGTGGLVRLLSARADRAEGIDVSQEVIDVARRQAALYPSARFECATCSRRRVTASTTRSRQSPSCTTCRWPPR